jgi:hypothetical protein
MYPVQDKWAAEIKGMGYRRFGHSERFEKSSVHIFLPCNFPSAKPKQEKLGQ